MKNLQAEGGVDTTNRIEIGVDAIDPKRGYMLAAVHNIQADVSPENIVAMFDAARELGKY